MIVVVTGTPGAGKTLFAIDEIRKISERENRPVFVDGVDGLKLPWVPMDARKWREMPPNAILLVDEAQRVFRPASSGAAIPDFIADLETHRHDGVDIWLTTQHPSFLHAHLRKLAGRHYHLIRAYGAQKATLWRWEQIKDNCDKSRKDTVGVSWSYPKDVYALYKSAEVHTIKRTVPRAAWYLGACVLAFAFLAWRVYDRRIAHTDAIPGESVAVGSASVPQADEHRRPNGPLSAHEYVQTFQPRVQGLAYTAPAYDQVTKAVRAPYPAACLENATRGCECYTQQGTRLEVTEQLCRGIVKGGFFVAWDEVRRQDVVQAKPAVSDDERLRGGTPGLMTLGAVDTSFRPRQARQGTQ